MRAKTRSTCGRQSSHDDCGVRPGLRAGRFAADRRRLSSIPMAAPAVSSTPAPTSRMTPALPNEGALGVGTSLSADGGSADVEADSGDVDGAAGAVLADVAADLFVVGGAAVVGGAVVGRGLLRGGAEPPTVTSELPLL